MYARAALLAYCFVVVGLASRRPCQADDKAKSEPPAESAELLVTGTASLSDGSPAAGAVVCLYDYPESIRTTADGFGKFALKGPCLSGLRLHALSPDEREQAVLFISEDAARSYLSQPLTISLKPAKPYQVVARAEGQPVEGARVSIAGKLTGFASLQEGVTGANGTATLWLPADEPMLSVVAWHPQYGVGGITHGVNGTTDWGPTAKHAKTEISLLPPGSHVVRVLDSEDRPVAGRTIATDFQPGEGAWIYAKQINATRATTDETGEVHFDWFPKGVKYVNVNLLDHGWKIDKIDNDKSPDGLTTIHVRRTFPVHGRLIFPAVVDPRGILIKGSGFGPGSYGDHPSTRTRSDESFTLQVPAGYGYVLGVYDLEWTSDLWSGAVIPLEGEPQREIVLHGEQATPLEVVVTRGPSRQPVADTWMHILRHGQVRFTLESGETINGQGRFGGPLRTDEKGRAQAGVGRGEIEILLLSGDWRETKTIQVGSLEPVSVTFHRNWQGNRELIARPVVDGKKFVPSPDAIALAWSERSGVGDVVQSPVLTDDWTVKVEFDDSDLSLLLVDRRRRLSGFVQAKADDAEVELPMRPNAVYSGTLVDRADGSPLGDREVCLITGAVQLNVVEPQRTDGKGRFKFDNVAVGVPLWLRVQEEPGRIDYGWIDSEKVFQPGENKIGEVIEADAPEGSTVEVPIAKRIANAVENCRVTGMRVIVVLEGDESKPVKHLAGRLTGGEVEAIYRFLPVAVTAKQQTDDAASLEALKWPKPAGGEVILVVTADGKEVAAILRLASADLDGVFRRGTEFIEQHAPPTRDGRKRLDEAKAEAAKSKRTVWVISGGPRCGPCFLLARWIDRHHEVLEKDLVVVKLTHGIDTHANEIGEEIGGADEGIPFHAMLSPDGQILISSKGPQGNIGMPDSTDSRHFRKMLEAVRRNLTSAEVDNLIESLKDD